MEFNENDKFVPNIALKELIENDAHLTDRVRDFKREIKKSYQESVRMNLQLAEKISNYSMKIFNHFQEVRRTIDLHRENEMFSTSHDLIDDVALSMIAETKRHEQSLPNNKHLNRLIYFKIQPEQDNLDVQLRDPLLNYESFSKFNKSNT